MFLKLLETAGKEERVWERGRIYSLLLIPFTSSEGKKKRDTENTCNKSFTAYNLYAKV